MNGREVATYTETVGPAKLGRVVRTFNAYRVPILLSLAAVFCGYIIIAVILLLMSPTLTVTTIPFRLEFARAAEGRYPNGVPFSPTEIVAQPILTRVFEDNDLKRYMPLNVFTQSVYVLEANPGLERLVRDYQSRLADPKLTPIDRERLIREFDSKKQSISKNEYSLNFSAARDAHRLPESLVKKVLTDVLREWATHATRNQRVLQYSIPVMSPNIVPPVSDPSMNYVARLQVLRAKIFRVMSNLDLIRELPGGTLARTGTDQLALQDVRTQLEYMVRFRLEPLVPVVRASGLVQNLPEAIRFAEMQLAYDERQLAAAREAAQVIRHAIVTYSNVHEPALPMDMPGGADTPLHEKRPASDGRVTPLLGETFLERLMELSSAAADLSYRQDLIDEYRQIAGSMPPLQQTVTYDREVIEQLRSTAPGTATVTPEDVEQLINAMHREVHEALGKMNELYATISLNLAPDPHMYTTTSVPTTRTERQMEATKLTAVGMLVLLLAIPIILAGVLSHNRLRQEDEIEDHRETVVAQA